MMKMIPMKTAAALLGAAALLAGCASAPESPAADPRAPLATRSAAANLTAVFECYVPDAGTRSDTWDFRTLPDVYPEWRIRTTESLNAGLISAVPHWFGFVGTDEAADERAAVRLAEALALRKTVEQLRADGWIVGWTRPSVRVMSLSYEVRQDIFVEKPGTSCRLPAGIENLRAGAGQGCRLTLAARSGDVSKGDGSGKGGVENVPAWLSPAAQPAFRMRAVTLNDTGSAVTLLTDDFQRALAARTEGLLYFYGLDDAGRPFVGADGRIENFTAPAPEAPIAPPPSIRSDTGIGGLVGDLTGWVSGLFGSDEEKPADSQK